MPRIPALAPCLLILALTACEQLGIPDPAKETAAKEAEGKAIGGACRHAGRALEDCYTLNPKGHKASIFAGWKEMNDYMAENKIEVVKPEIPVPDTAAKPKDKAESEPEAEAAESPPAKSSRRRTSKAAAPAAEH